MKKLFFVAFLLSGITLGFAKTNESVVKTELKTEKAIYQSVKSFKFNSIHEAEEFLKRCLTVIDIREESISVQSNADGSVTVTITVTEIHIEIEHDC